MYFALAFFCTAVLANFTASANDNSKKLARPVARLVSTTRNEEMRPRARLITSRGVAAAGVVPRPVAASSFVATGDERRVFEMVNAARRENGRQQLVWDGELNRMARLHSQDMARVGQLAHELGDGMDMRGRAAACGITGWRSLGENVAYNYGFDDPQVVVVERWMESVKHRENILNDGFTHAGLGIATAADGRIFFTQVFITR